jgi:2-polyprenyl-3-methyl-5-hydroxy-6-metoxy-1,4-benzoquinol methylase
VLKRPRVLGAALIALAARYSVTYRHARRRNALLTAEHVARLRRVTPGLVHAAYRVTMPLETKIARWPRYDQWRQRERYRWLVTTALEFLRPGDTIVDAGCGTAVVLDMIAEKRTAARIGVDMNPNAISLRRGRPDPPRLELAPVEDMPLDAGIADVVVCSEVLEHLVDAYRGLAEVSRITHPGGIVVLTTNNASETPDVSPLRDPLTWVERLLGRWYPSVLSFRFLAFPVPVDRAIDPLPPEAPSYLPHPHLAFREVRDLARDAGLDVVRSGSFEIPEGTTRVAEFLRGLTERRPVVGIALSSAIERTASLVPGLRLMGTHQYLILRKVRAPLDQPTNGWWIADLFPRRTAAQMAAASSSSTNGSAGSR